MGMLRVWEEKSCEKFLVKEEQIWGGRIREL